ncbi:hypothetical protein A0J61_03001 [Choanephora cucurbitarum]|uniref:Actin-binding transcription modulator n=1 Tax=Choanephora cucurbitarum TaxID=101091 RepID=A0A1C7NIK2_9FUNG|nr:hypothetical protein A0J61_03001 [Choanephora cucurbitarum]
MADQIADYDSKHYLETTATWQQDPTAYLSRYYELYTKQVNHDLSTNVYVRQSPNKICVLGMTDPPAGIDQVSLYTDLVGQKVKKDTILCDLMQEGKVMGHVRAEMEGKLLELNAKYQTDDISSLIRDHMDIGFIAIIMPKIEDSSVQLKEFEKKTTIQK